MLAGIQILKTTGTPWQARCRVNASEKVFDSQGTVQQFFGQELVSQGLELEATGESPVYADIALNGYSRTRLTPEHQGMEVARSYFDLKGNPIDPSHLKTGDLVLVKLSVHSDIRVPQALVVDLLPAGLELENQNLPTSVKMDAIVVEDKPVSQWKSMAGLAHEEFRDDRYVAALDTHQGRTALLFYLARAVSPGRFSVPNPLVEDMYRPYYRSVGDTLEGMIIEQP